MRKKRSTVYVQPGKDVTLYIPTETPPEVIEYLNGLKREGYFSQGVMDILIQYVMERPRQTVADQTDPEAGKRDRSYDSLMPEQDELDPMVYEPLETKPAEPAMPSRMNLAEIFQRARHNSGKLLSHDQEGSEPL